MNPIAQQSGNVQAIPAAPLEEERLAWLALTMTDGLGPRRIWRAVNAYGSAERVTELALTQLETLKLPAAAAQAIVSGHSRAEAEKEWKRVQEGGGAIVTPIDQAYPERLREIFDPPTVLWIRGDAALLAQPGIAVVGTRHPTPYGTGMAEMLSRDLAAHGIVILSGMARGVDTAAHRGALEARGKTVAVWGTGIDVIYPKENKKLAEQILDPERIFYGDISCAAEFPHSQPDFERHERGRAGHRGQREQRNAHYSPLCSGTKSRGVCGARQRNVQKFLGSEHFD
jgi:hypothetical protein